MKVTIHNVDHGQCAVITMPNGERVMIDCGILSDGHSYWWPSIHYQSQRFALLALTNLDEDHAQDFGTVQRLAPPDWILTNPTVGYQGLLVLKRDGMRSGIEAVTRWVAGPKNPAPRPMDRAEVKLDAEGQVVVNTAKLYKWEKGVPAPGEFNDPGAYIPL